MNKIISILLLAMVTGACKSQEETNTDLVEPAAPLLTEIDSDIATNGVTEEKKPGIKPKIIAPKEPVIPPPVDKVTKGIVLPMPQTSTYIGIKSFMNEYKSIYLQFEPLSAELRTFFLALNSGDEEKDETKNLLKARVKENFERAHWVYLYSVSELTEYLLENSKNDLTNDKEINFIARMKVVNFLSKELEAASNDSKYLNFTKTIYISLSKKHFNRDLKTQDVQGK